MHMEVMDLFTQWSNDTYFDQTTRNELLALKDDPAAIRERFYRDLAFGTAGIRGIIGAGTNRINRYVVRRVSYGLAQLIVGKGTAACEAGIVIGYDSRNFSDAFAKEAAAVFAGNGIKVYLHRDIVPVPVLSFSVGYLKTSGGVMVTASHNPKEYNGYKAYGPDGAQMSPEDSKIVIDTIEKITDYTSLPVYDYDALLTEGKIVLLGDDVAEAYFTRIQRLIVNPEELKKNAENFRLVYTPVHGTGARFVPEILRRVGFNAVYCVEEQMRADGNFPTVPVPNPEEKGVYDLAIRLAEEKQANLLLATDPDADRTGVAVRDINGEYVLLTGNQIGVVLLNHILSGRSASGTLPEKGFVVSTVVSTRLTEEICRRYGVTYVDVLTGFKFIGEQIKLREEQGDETFLFGFEESFGYLGGSYAKDKDAVASCMLVAETAAYYAKKGMTLLDALEEIYRAYGYWYESQTSFTFQGEAGAVKMRQLMDTLRSEKSTVLPGEKVIGFKDFKTGIFYDIIENTEKKIDLPASDVLYYVLPDGWVCVRPSGTEPKVKFYFGAKGADAAACKNREAELKEKMLSVVENITK